MGTQGSGSKNERGRMAREERGSGSKNERGRMAREEREKSTVEQ